jgi:choline kinase
MLEGDNMSKIACDKSGYLEESMKITLGDGKINHISKKITEDEHYAVSIDVYRISSEDSKVLFKEVEDTIIGRKDENSWTEVALDNIFKDTNFQPYVIDGRWFEIDNHDDLHKAEDIFKGDKLCKI